MENTNAPAFPVSSSSINGHQNGVNTYQFTGITIRDYFAAHSPISVNDAKEHFYLKYKRNADLDEMFTTLAFLRLKYADAMMEARKE